MSVRPSLIITQKRGMTEGMKESLLIDVFAQAGLFLALSALIIPLLRSLNIPIVLGYLLAGIALGPYGMGALSDNFPILSHFTLQDAAHVKMLAELGIILLLFVIGLELTPRRLWQMRDLVFGLGGLQVVITAVTIGMIAYFWGNNVQISILLGLSLALSSTAIVIQWLHEQKLFITPMGRTSFSILLLQDLAVIPILLLLTIFTADITGNVFEYISLTLIKMIATVVALVIIGKKILRPVFIFANRHGGAEVFMALSLLVIVATSSIAAMAGLSMALGAFIAGVLLSDTEYRHEISSLIIPFKSMLLGIFFMSFGMGIDLNFMMQKPVWLGLSVIGLMTLKAVIIFILCKLWKQSTAISIESALLLSQAGEFGLLVTGSALTIGFMEQSIGQFMLLTIGLTMLLTPLIAPLARKVGEFIEARHHEQNKNLSTPEEHKTQHVVIFGFGRIGQSIAHILCQEGVDILGFEKNTDRVHQARLKSIPIYYGDATRKNTLDAAGLADALCAIVTIDDPQAAMKIVKSIRARYANIPIIVRAYSQEEAQSLGAIEYVYVIPEYELISMKLAEQVLQKCGFQEEETYRALQTSQS